jgi:hypothetical protein
MVADDLDGLAADRPGGTDERDFPHGDSMNSRVKIPFSSRSRFPAAWI